MCMCRGGSCDGRMGSHIIIYKENLFSPDSKQKQNKGNQIQNKIETRPEPNRGGKSIPYPPQYIVINFTTPQDIVL